jgi:hypothetical protein
MLYGGKNILGQYYQYHINGTVITPTNPQVCRNFQMLIFLLSSQKKKGKKMNVLADWSSTIAVAAVKSKSTRKETV